VTPVLPLPLRRDGDGRVVHDRLEFLTALIGAPSFDPVYRLALTVPFGPTKTA
jgi:hypothetical protein